MEPSVPLIYLDTTSLLCPATPPGAVHDFPGAAVQAPPPAAARYLVKFSVVPESSARCTDWIASVGSVTPGVSAATFGSCQFAIVPSKIPASTAGVRINVSTPDRLYAS